MRLFEKTTGNKLHTWINAHHEHVSLEQCARRCVLETRFRCHSFNFRRDGGDCALTEFSSGEAYGVTTDELYDVYQRKFGWSSLFCFARAFESFVQVS